MARIGRALRDFFHLLIGVQGHETPFLTGNFISEGACGRFEPRTLWGWTAATHEANARGIRLLKENLSAAQREQYERFGYFDVSGGESGKRYRIRNRSQMNVEQLDKKGKPLRLLCFMPEGELVVGDVMLAQKIALELFESDALAVANKFFPDPHLFGTMP